MPTSCMAIDNCTFTFQQLADSVSPGHFTRLEKSLCSPIAAEKFLGAKSATKQMLSKIGRQVDFPGCYVFLDNEKPVYVGISRTVVKRLVQHLNTDSHNSASLVYRMASKAYPHELKRDQAMKDDQFRKVFFEERERLRRMKVAFIEIKNDLELYVFEVFASMKLDTKEWNTFRTH